MLCSLLNRETTLFPICFQMSLIMRKGQVIPNLCLGLCLSSRCLGLCLTQLPPTLEAMLRWNTVILLPNLETMLRRNMVLRPILQTLMGRVLGPSPTGLLYTLHLMPERRWHQQRQRTPTTPEIVRRAARHPRARLVAIPAPKNNLTAFFVCSELFECGSFSKVMNTPALRSIAGATGTT